MTIKSGGVSLSRRQLLSGVVATGTVLVAGCDLSTEPGGDKGASANSSDDLKEAPELAAQVAAGDLPSLPDRLPTHPLVVEPVEQAGVYGGTWHTATTGTADTPWLSFTIGYDRAVHMDRKSKLVQPSVVENIEANDDGTEYTLQLRAGIKWSDGTPFTSDDIVFWVEDVLGNEELTPTAPVWILGGGKLPSIEAADEHTLRISFAGPNGLWLQHLASGAGAQFIGHPRHYLEQFHSAYADSLDSLVAEAGVSTWVELFARKAAPWENPELPTLQPWQISTPLAEDMTRAVADRNPYYWKVDSTGRQLPYLDRVVYDFFNDIETMLTRALNGDFGLHLRHFDTDTNKPVLARSRNSGDYRFVDVIPERIGRVVFSLNLTHQDSLKRGVFSEKDFRVGLSHAVNRQEIIDVVYAGQGEPWQAAPRPESEFYNEEFGRQYTEYAPDLAIEYLDKVLPERDDAGFRLGSDGSRFSFAVDVATGIAPDWLDVVELVKGYWAAVGIEIRVQAEDRSLYEERVTANKHDATIWNGDSGNTDVLLRPRWYVPAGIHSDYAIAWDNWYTSGGEAGEEPPERVKAQLDLYDQINQTADEEEQRSLMRQVLEIAKEEFYVIGVYLSGIEYGIAKNNFRNIPETLQRSVLYQTPGNDAEPSQFFIAAGG